MCGVCVLHINRPGPNHTHEEVRRSTGHTIVTTRYSYQQGYKSRQNYCQVQPTEDIGNYRRQDDVFGYELQLLLSEVLQGFGGRGNDNIRVWIEMKHFKRALGLIWFGLTVFRTDSGYWFSGDGTEAQQEVVTSCTVAPFFFI